MAESAQETMAELREAIEDQQFSSFEEVQAFASRMITEKNQAPAETFCGFSPEQIHRFLHFPFDSPELVVFNDFAAGAVESPVIQLFSLLVEAIGDKGIKATAKGNLSQKFCREAALSYWGEQKYQDRTKYGSIRSEMDFFDMHCLRLFAGQAGFVRKYRGKFILSQKCRKLIAKQGNDAVFTELLRTYATQFDWGYRDGYPEIWIVQQSFVFTLYLLVKFGNKSRPWQFYGDKFVQAFPMAFHDVPDQPYQTSEETVAKAYRYRVLEGFAQFFGLVVLEETGGDRFSREYKVIKTPLLDEIVSFNF